MRLWLRTLLLVLSFELTSPACMPTPTSMRNTIIHNEKAKILQRIHLPRRPESVETKVSYRVERDLTDFYEPEFGVESNSFEPISNSSLCRTMDGEDIIPDCFIYHLEVKGTVVGADFVLLLKPQFRSVNLTISIYEVGRIDGQLSRIDKLVVVGSSSISEDLIVKTDIKEEMRQWLRGNTNYNVEKLLMISAKVNGFELPFWDVFRKTPSIDVVIGTPEKQSSRCESSSKCCLMSFYLNFTELGWDDWILSPPGYHANYCVGQCPFNSDTETQAVLRSAKTNDSSFFLPSPSCAPLYYAPLKMIYTVGENDFRKSVLHGMTVLSCSCSSH
ncbi:unnamed protein product [Auanema sp. JU1783]|nr:unnamed protein product [Auanema sp. JU1783]